jgi:hypothetical protein
MDEQAGYKHFYEFYGKLNVISEIIRIKNDTRSMTSTAPYITLLPVKKTDLKLPKEINSEYLIKSFNYETSTDKKGNTISSAKQLKIGSVTEIINITINSDVIARPRDPDWFNHTFTAIFKIDKTDPNIKELHLRKSFYSDDIKHLFTFNVLDKGTDKTSNVAQYVWMSKHDMLALLDQPFLLLSFDMYYYNNNGKYLFENDFDVTKDELSSGSSSSVDPVGVDALFSIETFNPTQLPTFLMLLIYYAGYSFDITLQNITSKFRNKFNQSSNKTSFPIKLYVPISNTMETEYNNTVRSTIKPDTLDLAFETLQVYHVATKIASLWDYVNSKLTILIINMLNSKVNKAYYKTLFNKKYTLNKLFLFECISELKKYKEYILNPLNINSIEFPMSTLKTLEILILKLSYILSLLEPTFIPIETMSFDVIMNGKTLKYVINSELQATNISIDDHISNDTLMEAILSTRAAVMTHSGTTVAGIEEAKNFFSDSSARELQKSFIQKMVDTYKNDLSEKNIPLVRIQEKQQRLYKELDQKTNSLKATGYTDESLGKNEVYLNLVVQYNEITLEENNAAHEYEIALYKSQKADAILKALDDSKSSSELTSLFDDLNTNYPDYIRIKGLIEENTKQLASSKQALNEARVQKVEEKQKIETSAAVNAQTLQEVDTSKNKKTAAADLQANKVVAKVTVTQENIFKDVISMFSKAKTREYLRLGLSFGEHRYIYYADYELGKIYSLNYSTKESNEGLPQEFLEKLTRNRTYVLIKIDELQSPTDEKVIGNIWYSEKEIPEDEKETIFDKIRDANKMDKLAPTIKYSDSYIRAEARDKDENVKLTKAGQASKPFFDMFMKYQYLLTTLDNLTVGNTYRFTFKILPPKKERQTRGDSFSGGGKNTTKKVNRKQAQTQGKTHSKTKKVFESELIN